MTDKPIDTLLVQHYFGYDIIKMHNPSGKLKYYVRGSNQEWPTAKMAQKVIRTVIDLT